MGSCGTGAGGRGWGSSTTVTKHVRKGSRFVLRGGEREICNEVSKSKRKQNR